MALASLLLAGTGAVATSQTATAAEASEPLIDSESTTWTYSENNTDPSEGSDDRLDWTTSGFDDSDWKSAKGPFGAKNGEATGLGGGYEINTLLNQYINGQDNPTIPTYHFRTTIDLTEEDLGSLDGLEASMVHDDAAQVFVNGKKVAGFDDDRVEAADESERNLMYAGVSAGDPKESTFELDSSDFEPGENTIAVALYQDRETSSDIYFDFTELAAASDNATDPNAEAEPTDVVMTIGRTEAERNVTWYSDVDTDQQLQLASAADATGGEFPASTATTIDAEAGTSKTTSGQYRRSATMAGLKENSKYVYRVGNDTNGWSESHEFSTSSFDGDYDFLFFGDPQIGASGNVASDQAGWEDTIDVGMKAFPDSELLFSAGDQVETAPNEDQYDAFLAPKQLRETPLVPTIGNHDVGSKAYEQHFTVPNNDPDSGAGTDSSSGGDYWFMYKDVLYLNINSNNGDVASHKAFLEKVVAEQGPKAKWTVLAFHHSIYSVASHTNDQQILDLRGTLPQIISDLDIDLVLQGHDHSYTRSYLIKDGELADADEVKGKSQVTAGPGEVLYVTANSASGSKYYDVKAPEAWFASVINQEQVRNYSHVEVTDNSIKVKTLRSQAHDGDPVNSVVDEVTLQREDDDVPELTVPERTEITVGDDFDPLEGVSAKDAVDGDLTSEITVNGEVDPTLRGLVRTHLQRLGRGRQRSLGEAHGGRDRGHLR
jgi:hypothetical protein